MQYNKQPPSMISAAKEAGLGTDIILSAGLCWRLRRTCLDQYSATRSASLNAIYLSPVAARLLSFSLPAKKLIFPSCGRSRSERHAVLIVRSFIPLLFYLYLSFMLQSAQAVG